MLGEIFVLHHQAVELVSSEDWIVEAEAQVQRDGGRCISVPEDPGWNVAVLEHHDLYIKHPGEDAHVNAVGIAEVAVPFLGPIHICPKQFAAVDVAGCEHGGKLQDVSGEIGTLQQQQGRIGKVRSALHEHAHGAEEAGLPQALLAVDAVAAGEDDDVVFAHSTDDEALLDSVRLESLRADGDLLHQEIGGRMVEQELSVPHDVINPNFGVIFEHHLRESFGLPPLIDVLALVGYEWFAMLPFPVAIQMGRGNLQSIFQRFLVQILRRGEAGNPLVRNIDELQKAEKLRGGVVHNIVDHRGVGGQ